MLNSLARLLLDGNIKKSNANGCMGTFDKTEKAQRARHSTKNMLQTAEMPFKGECA